MNLLTNFLLVIWLNTSLIMGSEELKNQDIGTNKSLLTAGVYAKLFVERRKEQQIIIKKMMASDNYEKNFKLLQITFGKIFEILREKNFTLDSHNYDPSRDGFPQGNELQDAAIFILENCCIAAESLIHFPEISYRILKKQQFSEWKSVLNWCSSFVNSMPHVIDESTVKLMEILIQEINEEQRSANYINPYYEVPASQEINKQRKKVKKLKKGPSLSGAKTEL